MAGDALFAYLDAFDNVPAPSDINDVKAESGDFVQLVKAELYDGLSEVQRKKVIHEIETGLRQKGYTKNQAAQILGVNRSYMTKVAKGDSTPAPDMAKRIGLLLGFDWRVFYADGIAAI